MVSPIQSPTPSVSNFHTATQSDAASQTSINRGATTERSAAMGNTTGVDIGHAEPTRAQRASAFLSGTAIGMRGAVRGFVLAPSAFIVQTALGTANVLLEGVTDALFQVAKKGGLKEISDGNTNFSALLQHNVEHERSELAENKPYGHYLANDAKADFQRAHALFNRESGPAAFEVKTIDVGKNEAGGNKGIIQLNADIKAHFSNHNQNKPFQLGDAQRSSEQRVLHFLKHSGLATVDLLKATVRGGLAIGIAGIQLGKALGIGLASSIVDISFTVLKKGGLHELLKRESNIGAILRHNFERSFQQIADKPYALILGQDAMHDLYSLVTNLKSAVAFGAEPATPPNNDTAEEQQSAAPAEQSAAQQNTPPAEQSANDPVVTPAAPQSSEAHTTIPPFIDIAINTPLPESTSDDDLDETDNHSQSSGVSEVSLGDDLENLAENVEKKNTQTDTASHETPRASNSAEKKS